MPRYCDRDKVMQHLETDKYGYTDCVKVGIALDKAVVDITPPATGEWKINFDGYYPFCSNCGTEPKNGTMSNFCPNCGADMRGKPND